MKLLVKNLVGKLPLLLRNRFHSDDEIRAVEQVLLQVRDDYRIIGSGTPSRIARLSRG
jgi:hypothetical protein